MSLKWVPFKSLGTLSYSPSIVTAFTGPIVVTCHDKFLPFWKRFQQNVCLVNRVRLRVLL